jgi:hypothetical protein
MAECPFYPSGGGNRMACAGFMPSRWFTSSTASPRSTAPLRTPSAICRKIGMKVSNAAREGRCATFAPR